MNITVVAARNQAQRDQILESSAQPFLSTGRVEVDGSGETSIDIVFPVTYMEEPSFFFGCSLRDNEFPLAGSFPTCSVVVLRWGTRTATSGRTYYTGALLGVVLTGKPDQKVTVQWHMDALALRNPIRPEDSSGSTL